jgi:hypothetical protein
MYRKNLTELDLEFLKLTRRNMVNFYYDELLKIEQGRVPTLKSQDLHLLKNLGLIEAKYRKEWTSRRILTPLCIEILNEEKLNHRESAPKETSNNKEHKWSDKQRKNLSKTMIRLYEIHPIWKIKIRRANKGRKRTPEQCQRIRMGITESHRRRGHFMSEVKPEDIRIFS